jgi:hypothetical protein
MKLRILACISAALFLVSCGSAQPTPVTSESTTTLIPTRSLPPTYTLSPSRTATPTFDPALEKTVTPSIPEQCPVPSAVPITSFIPTQDTEDLMKWTGFEEMVLDFLNASGQVSTLMNFIKTHEGGYGVYMPRNLQIDLTNDGIPELILNPDAIYIFGCQSGQYRSLLVFDHADYYFNPIGEQLVSIQDANLDGVPEIILAGFGCGGTGGGQCLCVDIVAWNGEQFVSLFPPDFDNWTEEPRIIGGRREAYLPDVRLEDTDSNGTLELILEGDIPNTELGFYRPWRNLIKTYMWNGQDYRFVGMEYSQPEYRYQAVQDGDRFSLTGDFTRAEALYYSAITDPGLLGWSQELFDFWRDNRTYYYTVLHATPMPMAPAPDAGEAPALTAYSYYRILLIDLARGDTAEAQEIYTLLHDDYQEGATSAAYVEMLDAFWAVYRSTGKMDRGCASAIAYASNHQKEILTYLGSWFHNMWQDKEYQPQDICPF